MANRYRNRVYRSKTPDPESSLNGSWMATSPRMPRSRVPRRSVGGWGSMGNLDQIMNSLQESIQQKHKDCCSSFESLDNLSGEDDDSGIRVMDSLLKWKDSNMLSGAKHKQNKSNVSEDDDDLVFLPRRKNGPRSLQGSRENISLIRGNDIDIHTDRRTLPNSHLNVSPIHGYDTESHLRRNVQLPPGQSGQNMSGSSGQNLLGSSDMGLAAGSLNSNNFTDNWIMKQPDRVMEKRQLPMLKSPSWASDMNNNDESNNVSAPRFTKKDQSTGVARVGVSRARPRWDCASPVSIKNQDSGMEIITPDGRLVSDGYGTLPLKKKSQANVRLRQSSTNEIGSYANTKMVKTPARKSDTKPSPNYRKGFSLNAQRQLSSQSDTDDSANVFKNPSPRSRWDKTHVSHDVLSQVSKAASPDLNQDDTNSHGGTVLFISGKDESSSPSQKPVNAASSSSDKGGLSASVAVSHSESGMDGRIEDELSNRSYEAFYVSYGEDETMDQDNPDTAQPEDNIDEMTEEERAIKFPQWVIPFIDDNLAGKFEYNAQKRAAMTKKPASSSPRMKPPSPAPASSKRPKTPQHSDSGPVPPPRVKRTAAMTRILQEKDYLACRERPLADKPDKAKVKVPERIKSPVRLPKKLPRVPSETMTATSGDSPDSESFTVHYVKHAKAPVVSATKGAKLRSGDLQKSDVIKHSQSDMLLSQRAKTASKSDLSKSRSKMDLSMSNKTTSKNNLISKRAKSMDNLAVLSSLSSDKTCVNVRHQSTSSDSNMASPTENRAMRLMREARAQQARNTGADSVNKPGQRQSRTPNRKQPLTPTSSNESRDRTRSASTHGRFLSGRTTPLDKNQEPSSTRARARARFDRQDSTESESNTEQRPTRTRNLTPNRRSTSLTVAKEAEDQLHDTHTLPRRRPQTDTASTHSSGCGTLKATQSSRTLPKKSILKKTTVRSVSPAGPDRATAPEMKDAPSKRVLPRPPDHMMDDIMTDCLLNQSWMSTSTENLSRPSSRNDIVQSPRTPQSRTHSTSSDGSSWNSRHSSYASSKEILLTNSRSRDDVLKSPTVSKPMTRGRSANNSTERSTTFSTRNGPQLNHVSDNSTKGLHKTSFSSSRENLHRRSNSRDNLKSPTTIKINSRDHLKSTTKANDELPSKKSSADNPIKSPRRTGFTSSRENLFKNTPSNSTSQSTENTSQSTENPETNSMTSDDSIKSVKLPATVRSRMMSSSSSRLSRQNLPLNKRNVPEPISLSKSGLQPADSIKINKKPRQSTVSTSSRRVSDRFKKLLDGDVSQLSTPVKNEGINERENSFDSGVEFVMHL